MSRGRYLLKNAGILAASNFASKILVFLLVPLYTSVLTTSEYGVFDLINSTISLLLPILTFNIADSVMRFCMDSSYPKDKVVCVGFRYTFFSVFVAWAIILVVRLTGVWPALNGFEIIAGLFYFFYAFNNFLIQTAKGNEKIFDMGVAAVLGTVVMIVGNIIFLLVFRLGLPGFFYANVLAQAIPVLYLSIRLKIYRYFVGLFSTSNEIRLEMIRYCLPLIATVIGWWANSTSDRYVVAAMCGVGANGLLSVSYKIPSIINTLQSIFTQAWQISAIKEYKNTDKSVFYGKTYNFINLFVSLSCSLLIILTKPLACFLYSNDFYDAWRYVPFLLISCVINGASGVLGPILSAKKDSKSMALSAVYGTISNVLLNILFVYLFDIQGACIATVCSSFIIFYVRKRAVRNDIFIEREFLTLFTWILLCVQAVIEIYTCLWWCELFIMLIILVINQHTLVDSIKTSVKFISSFNKKRKFESAVNDVESKN